MALRPRTPYRFTDPLGAADGAPEEAHKVRARLALAALYLVGAITLGVTLLTPDSDTSDHTGIAVIAIVMLSLSLGIRLWRGAPDVAILAAYPVGVTAITALVAVAKPVALIPIFYVWPILLAGYFLQRREVVVTFVLVAIGFAVSLRFFVVPDGRMIQWLSVVVVDAVLGGLIVALKERLTVALDRLHTLATRDALTGVLNRRGFSDAFAAAVARARRSGTPCAIALLDIDHFKTINDRFGHAEGDRALCHLTSVLCDRQRAGDVVGRLGGEEFAVVLEGAEAAGAEDYANDLRRDLAAAATDPVTSFTVSIGVADLSHGDGTSEGLALAVDRALYAAKDAGRDRVVRAASRPAGDPAG